MMKNYDFKFNRNKKFKTKFFISLYKIIDWLSVIFPDRLPEVSIYRPFLLQLDEVLYSRGPLFLIKYVKNIRSQYMNYLSDNPVRVEGIGLTKDGLPKSLGDLIPKIRQAKFRVRKDKGEDPYRFAVHQTLMTILFSTRSLKAGNEVDIDSIISPCIRECDITEYIPSF